MNPCGRDSVLEHPRDWTRTAGTEPASYPTPGMVRVSGGTDGAVRRPWIPRNRRRAALADAWRRPAATYEVDARSRPPIAETRPVDSRSHGGSAPRQFRIPIPWFV